MGYLPYDITIKTTTWIIILVFLGIIASYFLMRSLKAEEKSQKDIFRAMALFFYFYILARIFFIFSDFERDLNDTTLLHYRFVALAYIAYILGFLSLIYILEKHVIIRTKHIITYILLVTLGVNIVIAFFPELMPIVRYINYGILYFEVVIVFIIYTYLTINTTGKLRTKSFLTVIALIIMVFGELIESEPLIASGIVLVYYTPILFAIGASIFAYAQSRS